MSDPMISETSACCACRVLERRTRDNNDGTVSDDGWWCRACGRRRISEARAHTPHVTAEQRVRAARIGHFNEYVEIDAVWCDDAIRIVNEAVEAAVAKVEKDLDEARRCVEAQYDVATTAIVRQAAAENALFQMTKERVRLQADLAYAHVDLIAFLGSGDCACPDCIEHRANLTPLTPNTEQE